MKLVARARHGLLGTLAAGGRRYPLKSGCGKIAAQSAMRRLAADQAASPAVTTLRCGARMWVDLDDYIGRAVFYFGDFDPKITWVLERVLRPGDSVVDIGANAGVVTLCAAKLVGPSGSVHSIEPQPALAALLKRSAALNGFEHVQVHELALSEQDGFHDLWIPKGLRGQATLEATLREGGSAIRVPTRRAGDFLAETTTGRPRLVKIDVEGHEAAVIHGAREYLQTSGPDVFLFEEHRRPASDQDSIIGLRSAGYAVFALAKAKIRMRLQRLGSAGSDAANDFVAVRGDLEDEGLLSALGIAVLAPGA